MPLHHQDSRCPACSLSTRAVQTDAPTGLKREWYMLCHASMRAFHRPCDMCQYTQSCAVQVHITRRTYTQQARANTRAPILSSPPPDAHTDNGPYQLGQIRSVGRKNNDDEKPIAQLAETRRQRFGCVLPRATLSKEQKTARSSSHIARCQRAHIARLTAPCNMTSADYSSNTTPTCANPITLSSAYLRAAAK